MQELNGEAYVPKTWTDEYDYSQVYKIVVRVLGGTPKPIQLPPPYEGSLDLLPFNLCPLGSVTDVAARDRGFGVWGLGVNDADNFGAILNVTEWRYHPTSLPDGWAAIGGLPTTARIDRQTTWADRRESLGLAKESDWLSDVLSDVRSRCSSRFDLG